jgi:hypothetical protein
VVLALLASATRPAAPFGPHHVLPDRPLTQCSRAVPRPALRTDAY